MNDWIAVLLVVEGIPLLAFIYYLEHKRRMYILERGIPSEVSPEVGVERRVCNGLFLVLIGLFVLSLPAIADLFGLEVSPTLELILSGFVILSAGLSLILGTWILRRERTGLDLKQTEERY